MGDVSLTNEPQKDSGTPKRPYGTPRLHDLGPLRELTQTNPSSQNTDDGSGSYHS